MLGCMLGLWPLWSCLGATELLQHRSAVKSWGPSPLWLTGSPGFNRLQPPGSACSPVPGMETPYPPGPTSVPSPGCPGTQIQG